MKIHPLTTATLTAMASATTAASAKKINSAKHRNSFVKAMRASHDARGHRRLSKDQTPTPKTFAEELSGDSERARSLRKKVIQRAKPVPVPRDLQNNNNQNNNQGNNNNNQGNNNDYEDGADDYFMVNGEWENTFGFDATQYSVSYHRCATVQQYDDEVAQRQDTTSVFATKRFAVFRFCPSQTCEGVRPDPTEEEWAEYMAQQSNQNQNQDSYAWEQQQQQQEQYDSQPVYYNGQYIPQSTFDRLKVGGANGDSCQSNYGEYMLELEDYLDLMVEYHNERFEKYCETCEDCMYEVYMKWLQSGGDRNRKLKAVSDSTWKDDLESEDFKKAHRELGFNPWNICPEYDTCRYYGNSCQQGVDDSLTQYFECTEVESSNGQIAYLGPKCSEDGATITLGVYADEYCYEDISSGFSIKNILGFNLEGDEFAPIVSGSLIDVIPEEGVRDQMERWSLNYDAEVAEYYTPLDQMCIPCMASRQPYEYRGIVGDYADQDDDGEGDANEINELCENLYMVSARCDKHFRSYSSRVSQAKYAQAEALVTEDLTCDFIDSIVMGNYDETGLINSDNMNKYDPDATKSSGSMMWAEYGHNISEVTGLQIFSLIATLAACAVLGVWAFTLRSAVEDGKKAWRPRLSAFGSKSPAGAHDTVERERSSGSNMDPIALEDRNGTFYMS